MNELELVRELGEAERLPELSELDGARAQLMAAIVAEPGAAPERPRVLYGSRRTWRRFVVAGIACAAGVAAVATVGSGDFAGTTRRAPWRSVVVLPASRLPVIAHPTAAQVLARAAFVALHTTASVPRADQFVYTKTEGFGGQITQSWMSVSGTRTSRVGGVTELGCANGTMSMRLLGKDGKPLSDFIPPSLRGRPLTTSEVKSLFGGTVPRDGPLFTRPCTPQPAYFPAMPTQSSAILPYLGRTQGVRPGDLNDIAKTVGDLLDTDYVQPAQQAALYEFLARTPGITVAAHITDPAGRPGVGVAWSFEGSSAMLIFDPATYTYLGTTTTGIEGQKAGTALLDTAIVDHIGQPPAATETPGA